MTLRVLIADDQELVLAGLTALLSGLEDMKVVGGAANGAHAVSMIRELLPDIALMDIRMPILDGIEATRRVTADPNCHDVRVIILTTFGLDEYVFGALRAGASGFLLKDTPPDELRRAIRSTAAGESLLSPAVTRTLISEFVKTPARACGRRSDVDLTNRERDILTRVAAGMTNDEIARDLYIGGATVKSYIGRLLRKLDASTRVHLVIRAYEFGIAGGSSDQRGEG